MNTARTLTLALAVVAGAAMAACSNSAPTDATPSSPALVTVSAGPSTAAERWNAVARQIVGRRELVGPLGIARSFALVGVAQYDAVVLAERRSFLGNRPSPAGAAAGAAAGVLAALYPLEQTVVDSQLAADATLPTKPNESWAAGVELGRAVAAAALRRAGHDGTTLVFTGTAPVGPGFWRSAPAPARPLSPRWGEARPWLMSSGSQFRPAPPPAFGTPEFTSALAEVRALTDNRTPAQLTVAQFWGVTALGGPLGYWNNVALGLARSHGFDERRSARMLAVIGMAEMDASIGCWDAKYAFWYVRPFQADPAITTPVGRPNFPSYPSAHSCLSAAAAGVIVGLFPETKAVVDAQVDEAGVARMYAGLHYRFDITAGQALGYSVARLALQRAPEHGAIISLE